MNILSHVRALVREFHSNGQLLDVVLRPDPSAKPATCFRSVAGKIEREGGSGQMGWMFEGYEGFLDVIHHCVWCDPNGQLIDITPFDDMWRDTVVTTMARSFSSADDSATLIKPAGCEFGLARPNRLHIYNNKANLTWFPTDQEERKWEQAIRTNPSKPSRGLCRPLIVALLEPPKG